MTILPFTLSNDDISTTNLPCEYAIHTVHGTFPSHRHDCLELSLVIGGLGREIVNEAEHVMQPFSAKRRA